MEKVEIEWRDIPGYEGLYRVSEYGDVMSLDRIVRSGYGHTRIAKEKLLKETIYSEGYLFVNLSKKGKVKTYGRHVLVAMAFIPNPNNFKVVKHLDNIKINNHYTNLMWDTNSNNVLEAFKDGLNNNGEKNNKSKLKNEDVVDIKNSELPVYKLVVKYKVTRNTIWKIKNNIDWKHL